MIRVMSKRYANKQKYFSLVFVLLIVGFSIMVFGLSRYIAADTTIDQTGLTYIRDFVLFGGFMVASAIILYALLVD